MNIITKKNENYRKYRHGAVEECRVAESFASKAIDGTLFVERSEVLSAGETARVCAGVTAKRISARDFASQRATKKALKEAAVVIADFKGMPGVANARKSFIENFVNMHNGITNIELERLEKREIAAALSM